MRSISRLLLVVVAVTLLAAASHAAGKPEDGIRAVADAYVKASLAGDVKAIVALYTNDAMEMPPNSPAVKGHDAIEAYYRQQMAAGKLTSFTIDHLDVQAVGDHGYDVGTYKQSVTMNGKTMDDTGKYIVVARREGASWKVAYVVYNSDLPAPAAPAN